jgi:hypothetical protein
LVWAVGASQGAEIDRCEINWAKNDRQHLLAAKQCCDTQHDEHHAEAYDG